MSKNTSHKSVPLFPEEFHEATKKWFGEALGEPALSQSRGWAEISKGNHTLIAAPTGTGKTLAAFMTAIDRLARDALSNSLKSETRVLYISPLKALSNDISQNLDDPLAAIAELAGLPVAITKAVRTGDTSPNERAKMLRNPPNILATTPEGLYALVTSQGGRKMLSTVQTVIIDEIHALAGDRRGAHLSISLERLDALIGTPAQRIGLSATQKPIELVAEYLVGSNRECAIVDETKPRKLDVKIKMPGSPLLAIAENEMLEEVYDQIANYAETHKTVLVFVNSRRQCERVSHVLRERIGEEFVTTHHGSLSLPIRMDAERRLKSGQLKLLVATASLELGLDIGDVDLVIQLGAVKRISMFLQRLGRSNHHKYGTPKGRIFPLSRDDLVECVALMRAVDDGILDTLEVPPGPLDVAAQQIVAASSEAPWKLDELYSLFRKSFVYQNLARDEFDELVAMLCHGFATERGRRGIMLHKDPSAQTIEARKGAKMTALTSGGTIPDSGDYKVRLEPEGVIVGAIAEDFAIHQMPGHVIQLGSNTWRVLGVKSGEVRVEGAPGEAPYMPVWFGELPARSPELTKYVCCLKAEIADLEKSAANEMLKKATWLCQSGIEQLINYIHASREALGVIPSHKSVVVERFSDLTDNTQLVVHCPFGVRVSRAWALALRHLIGTMAGVEIQAAATDDGFLLSLPGSVDLRTADLLDMVVAGTARTVLEQAVLHVPMFMIRWRHVSARALMVPRMRGGRRVPPHIQRTDADELLLSAFPTPAIGRSLRVEAKQGGANSQVIPIGDVTIPDQPLVNQTIRDCLEDAMDIDGFQALLDALQSGEVTFKVCERLSPSPAAFSVITAKPPAFLDNGALMDRRARNIDAGPRHLLVDAETHVDPEALAHASSDLKPRLLTTEDVAIHISICGFATQDDLGDALPMAKTLVNEGRLFERCAPNGRPLWADIQQQEILESAFDCAAGNRDDQVEALANILAGRIETSGPIDPQLMHDELGLSIDIAERSLERLVSDGYALKGFYDPKKPDQKTYLDRRVLARVERLTRNKLRAEIEPVSLSVFFRFLLSWQGLLPHTHREGQNGLSDVLDQLDGIEAPANDWEDSILPDRLTKYHKDDFDGLCLSGQFGWGRRSAPIEKGKRPKLSTATPIAVWRSENIELWRASNLDWSTLELGSSAQALLKVLENDGASFVHQFKQSARLLGAQYEEGIAELVAAGLVTSDSFAGLRALLSKPSKTRVSRLDVMANSNSGRWSLLPQSDVVSDPVEYNAAVERYSKSLLRRYGVVVRSVIAKERSQFRWIDVLRVLRRMEARGEVRGGYFVSGAGGEHFALPEALPMMKTAAQSEQHVSVALAASDPLNLTGVIGKAVRVPARPGVRILFNGSTPLAYSNGRAMKLIDKSADITNDQAALLNRKLPSSITAYR